VWFDVDVDVCIKRVAERAVRNTLLVDAHPGDYIILQDHATIPLGCGERIVRGFAAKLEPPSAGEALFGQVKVVRTSGEAVALLRRWGAYALVGE
jgi:hypothetical protein